MQTAAATAAPQILGQPQNRIVASDEAASFSVVAADTRALTYQWRFNGIPLGGSATNDSVVLPNVSPNNEGEYRVVLTNPSGSVTSAPAFLMLDSDADGVADSWELTYFTNLNATATADVDGDGVSNFQEFLDNTNPTNSASARYRVLVLREGGSVVKTPDKPSYTNGEIVTLTVSASSNETFHAWLGDVVSRSNSVSLSMTRDKTVHARFTPIVLSWANLAGGNWETATNWTPNLKPGLNDSVHITNASSLTVTLNTPADCADVTLGGGNPTLTGSGTLTVRGNFLWTAGTISGSGRIIIESGATLNIPNPGTLSLNSRTLENGGTVLWSGAGGLLMNSGVVISNRAGALFEMQNATTITANSGACRIDNAGTFRKSVNVGTTTFPASVSFNNSGTVDIRSGILAANGGYHSTSNALLNCALGGTAPGTNYGQLQVAGAVTLNGALSVDFTNGYSPALNDSFTVLTAGTRNGTFGSFIYPSNPLTMQLTNTANSVIAQVTGISVPQPLLLSPQLSGTNVLLTWTAISNVTYRLERNGDLNPTNWAAVAGDVTASSNRTSKLDPLTSSNRVYRVRVLP